MKLGISRRSRAVTAKKCTKKHDARTKLLFWLLNLLLLRRFRCRRRRRILRSLLYMAKTYLRLKRFIQSLFWYCEGTQKVFGIRDF